MANVLVVDDEAPMRNMVTQMLQRDGHQVTTSDEGGAALDLMKTHRFDLVVLDVLMPGKDGIETTLAMKEQYPDTKILVMSGGRRAISAEFNLSSASLLGADASIQKPFDWNGLRGKLAELLG